MGEIEKALEQLAAEHEARRRHREAADAAFNERVRDLQTQRDALDKEMIAHADACPTCAASYVRNGGIAFAECAEENTLCVRADTLYEEERLAYELSRSQQQ